MEKTLMQILPLAVAASFSPTGLLLVMMILSSRERPRWKALNFIFGSLLFLIVLGLAALAFFRSAAESIGHPTRISGVVDIALGVLIILFIAKSVIFGKKTKPEKKEHKIPYILVGFLFMLVNTSTLIVYLAACKIIAADRLPLWDNVVLLTVLIAITMLLITFPVAVSYLVPRQSERILGPVEIFMSRHGNQIAKAYFFFIGIYLVAHGIIVILRT